MKLFFASHSSQLAGAEQSLLRLVSAASSRGHTGIVSVPGDGPLLPALREASGAFRVHGIRTHAWMGRRSVGLVGGVRLVQCLADTASFVRALKSDKFDAVVVNTSVIPAPLLAGAICGTPVILVIRETIQTNPTLKSVLPRAWIRWICSRLASDVVTVSEFVSKQYEYPSTVIYPQIDPVFFDETQAANELENARDGSLRGVMLGYFTEEKGQLEAIEAIASLAAEDIRIGLDIYGSGPKSYTDVMQAAIDKSGIGDLVRIHPPTNEPKVALRTADFSIVCSKNEAFGKVTAESILVGTPVIGYNVGGTAEILRGGGGILVQADSISLSMALGKLAADRDLLDVYTQESKISPLRPLLKTTATDLVSFIETCIT